MEKAPNSFCEVSTSTCTPNTMSWVPWAKYFLQEMQPVHPKGDQSGVFIGRTDVEDETPIWPPDAKS